MSGLLETGRPFCAEVSLAAGEPLAATASRIEHWLLVEYGGQWPYEPLDAAVFVGSLRAYLAAQLASLPRSRLLLVKRADTERGGRVRVVYGRTAERGSWYRRVALAGHHELLGLDLAGALRGDVPAPGEPLDAPLLLVCTHGVRDRCCARYGQALCRALTSGPLADWAWQASHVGGDRFAGNLVCLPEGVYYGRVAPDDLPALLDAYVAGRADPSRYRGRSCHAFPVQAADLHVRRLTGLDGFHDLRTLRVERTAGGWSVELLAELSGDVHRVDVAVERGDAFHLTCRAEQEKPPRHFVVRAHGVVPPAAPGG